MFIILAGHIVPNLNEQNYRKQEPLFPCSGDHYLQVRFWSPRARCFTGWPSNSNLSAPVQTRVQFDLCRYGKIVTLLFLNVVCSIFQTSLNIRPYGKIDRKQRWPFSYFPPARFGLDDLKSSKLEPDMAMELRRLWKIVTDFVSRLVPASLFGLIFMSKPQT